MGPGLQNMPLEEIFGIITGTAGVPSPPTLVAWYATGTPPVAAGTPSTLLDDLDWAAAMALPCSRVPMTAIILETSKRLRQLVRMPGLS